MKGQGPRSPHLDPGSRSLAVSGCVLSYLTTSRKEPAFLMVMFFLMKSDDSEKLYTRSPVRALITSDNGQNWSSVLRTGVWIV